MLSAKQKILQENCRRKKAINAQYDPLSGIGSDCCPRRLLKIAETGITNYYLPEMMFDEPIVKILQKAHNFDDAVTYINKNSEIKVSQEELRVHFIKTRIKYDFEFWAYSFIKIKPKQTAMKVYTEPLIPFKLNRGQRKYLKVLYRKWMNKEPIRIALLKARQWGGSTLTQIFMAWMQLVQHQSWNSVIVAHVENAARIIRGMYTIAVENYPWQLMDEAKGELELVPYEGSTKTRYVAERNCRLSIGSSEKPEGLRSEDITMAHFSEVASYVATDAKKPEDIMQSIEPSIPFVADSMIVYESTAKGVGNFWHHFCLDARNGTNGYELVFVAWFDIENYAIEIDDYGKFVDEMNDEEKNLFHAGATLEQIAWFRMEIKKYRDKWRFYSEFPSTFIQAFQSSGNRYYPQEDVEKLRKTCKEPQFIGDIMGADTHGKAALDDVHFVESPERFFRIWEKPDTEEVLANRYLVVVDVNRGLTSSADNGVICVFDRYWQKEGGVPEVVAEWVGHIQMRYFIWKAVQIASWYQNAFLIIESNTPDSAGQPGFEMESVMDEIAGYYDNLYCRTPAAQIAQGLPRKWGFYTDRAHKLSVCSHQQIVLQNDMYIERSIEAADEHDTFERKDDGTLGGVAGSHDDRHITRAIGVWACYKVMPLPTKTAFGYGYKEGRIVNESTM